MSYIVIATSNHAKVLTCGFDQGRECAAERTFRIEIRDNLVRVSVRTLRWRIIIGKFRDQGNNLLDNARTGRMSVKRTGTSFTEYYNSIGL